MSQYLEDIWNDILSRRPARVKRRFSMLDKASQQQVLIHLNRMVTEDGWQEVQVTSARAALSALDNPETGKDG